MDSTNACARARRTGQALALAAAMLLAARPAAALDTLSAADLAQTCADAGEGTCLGYIRGFIDGAIATDPRVALNVAREFEGPESFADRAYRTRLGDRLERYGPSYFAEFCVPVPVPLADIAQEVRDELARKAYDPGASARDVVYDALRQAYPCADQPGRPPTET
jgi:hypothetical protein